MGWAEGCVWPFVAPRPGYWQSQGVNNTQYKVRLPTYAIPLAILCFVEPRVCSL